MNERIRELIREAESTTNEGIGFEGQEYLDMLMERFAQLIVRECQTVVEWAISMDSTIDRVPVLIQEHFGVEE
jgi:hypothetical protein